MGFEASGPFLGRFRAVTSKFWIVGDLGLFWAYLS